MTKLAMPFSNPSTYKGHSGVDFGQPMNKEILASDAGKVNWSGYVNERAGYGVIVVFDSAPGIEWLYAHMPERGIRPNKNSRFVQGGYIGSVGSTGRSTGPHLHLEQLNGIGAHTYEGVWNYFDKNNWIGKPSTADNNSKPLNPVIPEIERGEMFIAACRGSWFLIVPSGSGKPNAVVLGGDSGGDKTGIPVVKFTNTDTYAALRTAVDGLPVKLPA